FESVPVAGGFITRLDALGSGSVGLDGALEQARAFRAAAERLDKTAEAWRARYAAAEATDDAAADILNACMKRLSRSLVPLASTSKGTYGHDPYGFTPQGTMIPSLFDVPRYVNMRDGEERWMLETALVRARNHVCDALDDCCTLINDTLAKLR